MDIYIPIGFELKSHMNLKSDRKTWFPIGKLFELKSYRKYFSPIGNIIPVELLENLIGFSIFPIGILFFLWELLISMGYLLLKVNTKCSYH